MVEPVIHGIFPTPIMVGNINREFTSDEKYFIDNNKTDAVRNFSNKTSLDNHVLNHDAMNNVHNDIMEFVNHYMNKIVSPRTNVTPYVTQSWLNYTETGQLHHPHNHENSFISGVLYINADKQKDKIFFGTTIYKQIFLEPKQYNQFNSTKWWFAVSTGDIILFPSSLIHHVENTTSLDTRISLAFNIFLKGTIGDSTHLTELVLS